MKKRMEEIQVHVNEGRIILSQPDPELEAREAKIWVSPDQVDVLIEWLKEAKEEVQAN